VSETGPIPNPTPISDAKQARQRARALRKKLATIELLQNQSSLDDSQVAKLRMADSWKSELDDLCSRFPLLLSVQMSPNADPADSPLADAVPSQSPFMVSLVPVPVPSLVSAESIPQMPSQMSMSTTVEPTTPTKGSSVMSLLKIQAEQSKEQRKFNRQSEVSTVKLALNASAPAYQFSLASVIPSKSAAVASARPASWAPSSTTKPSSPVVSFVDIQRQDAASGKQMSPIVSQSSPSVLSQPQLSPIRSLQLKSSPVSSKPSIKAASAVASSPTSPGLNVSDLVELALGKQSSTTSKTAKASPKAWAGSPSVSAAAPFSQILVPVCVDEFRCVNPFSLSCFIYFFRQSDEAIQLASAHDSGIVWVAHNSTQQRSWAPHQRVTTSLSDIQDQARQVPCFVFSESFVDGFPDCLLN
jgi:hypothetical protein